MTVTMTFCDKCGTVIREGTPIETMVLEGREYDLCPECHTLLTATLQSKGRPVPPPGPEPVVAPAPVFVPQTWSPLTDSSPWVPNTIPLTPPPVYPTGTGTGTWQSVPVLYPPILTGGSGAGSVTSTVSNAISAAWVTIGTAIAATNSACFLSKD